ncbi:MAG: glycosyltransferase [Microthrixaceae bacterium]
MIEGAAIGSGGRVLVITWDGGGVVPVELALAGRLRRAGHDVHVLADPPIEPEAKAVDCTFSPWTTAPHAASRRAEDAVVKDWEYHNPLRAMQVYMRDFLADPAPRWAADVDALLEAEPFDVVVVDFALPSAKIPAEARGIPIVSVMPNCWILPTKGIPPFGPGFAPSNGPLARLRDPGMRAMTRRLFDRALPALNETRRAYGLAPAASTIDQMLVGQTLVCSSPLFDFTSPHQPSTISYVGPVLDDPAWVSEWESPWPAADDRPLVLASLSSGFQGQVGVLNAISDALASLPVRGLVTLGAGVDLAGVPSRSGVGDVRVVQSAPHARILPEAAAVVTHCGHGTTLKALVGGVPMVCMPMGRDQNDTAARVVHHGCGVRIKPTASADAISRAVRRVLDTPRYRDAAVALGGRIAAGEGCADPLAAIEAAMARPTRTTP